MLPTSSSPQNNEEFLKLKYKVTFKDWKIEVGVVLFSQSNASRSKYNLPGKLIDKLMEFTARDWVQTYVNKIIGKTEDAKIFIQKINHNGGVRKSELIDLMIDTKIKEITFPDTVPDKGKLPSLNFLNKFIVENFNHATGSASFDEKIINSYVNYLDPEKHKVTLENFSELNDFVLAFQKLINKNPNSPLVVKNIGRVKFLMNSLKWFKRDVYPREFSEARKRVTEIIKKTIKKPLDFETKNLLSEFVNYLTDGVDGNHPEYLFSLIQIADSNDVVTLLGLNLEQGDVETLKKDMQVIIAELNEDLIAPENIYDAKFFKKKLNLSLIDITFIDSNKRVNELWDSKFFDYLLKGDIVIDNDSFTSLKDLSGYALSNFDLFRATLASVDKDILTRAHIYLKKLAADLIIFENDLQEIES